MLWQMHGGGVGRFRYQLIKIPRWCRNNNELTPCTQSREQTKTLFRSHRTGQEILQLLVDGLSYKEIGVRLQYQRQHGEKHVINIYDKLHVNGRAQALHLAYERDCCRTDD